jgi:AraC-like DNA-binding protein
MSARLFVRLDEDSIYGPESAIPAAALHAFAVHPALRPHVSHILHYQESFPAGQEAVERVLPDGTVKLVVNLGSSPSTHERRAGETLAVGPSARCALVRLRGTMNSLSVAFRPGASEALLGAPAGDISEKVVSLTDLWGADGATLPTRLAEQANINARVELMQSELVRRLPCATSASRQTATHALDLLIAGRGRLSVHEVAVAIGLSERRLQQLFQTHIGLPPTAWRRLARLHACLRALRQKPDMAWADLAVATGFYDQSHLINEFRDLCGCTPAAFRRQAIAGSSKTAA